MAGEVSVASAPILITAGDPAGVGPELVERLLLERLRLGSLPPQPILYLLTYPLDRVESSLAAKLHLVSELPAPERVVPGRLYALDLSAGVRCPIGQPSAQSGALAFGALKVACDYALRYPIRGLLTAPLAKEWVVRSGVCGFTGHTDYLAERSGVTVLMLMHSASLSVVPLTVHLPLRDVDTALRHRLAEPALVDLLKKVAALTPFGAAERWALCGLNPHAGEGGELGREEIELLEPWAESMRSCGLPLEGPLPADGIFMREELGCYRLVLSCYHDQGLIPFKAVAGRDGINATIGLPFVRTSPDHGTAFSLAGRGVADSASTVAAFDSIVVGEFLL